MARYAKRAGAKIFEDCPVCDVKTTETLLGGRKVSEIHTSCGIVKTNVLVNATGRLMWGGSAGRA